MLVLLTFVACLAASAGGGTGGGQCRDVEIVWEGTAFQCMLFGQREVARWADEHPGLEPRAGHRCTTAGRPV